ncbi:unnamed protein product [Rotaria socialis]|uniref:Uncharacterized protein n=1 Tax=Rotaria socialis TaxID=392032 RepID=A0A817PSP0_9BILA|nr:unnamed protein product [Rotaria socialis]CAF3313321.1 unnamed protein product [Rotaria socialis]CAF4323022.1 unnamed protein product [Rotaria socialis]CAF4666963.1 unnamed protein product [Rotaria socialis]
MLLGNVRRDMNTDYRRNSNALYSIPPLMNTSLSLPKTIRTSIIQQKTMMNYDHKSSYCYTTVALLSLRSSLNITIFPDHLVERRFLDKENYIDLDRMLVEKAGKFDLKSFNMSDGPILPSRIHKYDFSDTAVIEKVKGRRPKHPLTPQQVAALTTVATRYQPSTSLDSHQSQSSHVWIDDYSHRKAQNNSPRHHLPAQPLMPYQRQNPNQCELYTNQIKSLLSTYQSSKEQKNDETINKTANTIPILQRLFEAQRLQKVEQGKLKSSEITDVLDQQSPSHLTSTPKYYEQGSSVFCTPTTPKQSNSNDALEWICSTNKNQNDVFTQRLNEHLNYSTTLQTPTTSSSNSTSRSNNDSQRSTEEDDQQNFFSALPSPIEQQESLPSILSNRTVDKLCCAISNDHRSLEYWFGTSIHQNTYPRVPSENVLSACDFEQ